MHIAFSILLFFNTIVHAIVHMYKEKLHQWQTKLWEPGKDDTAQRSRRNSKPECSYWKRLALVHTHLCHHLISGTTAIFTDASRFNQPGKSQSIHHLPKPNHTLYHLCPSRNTAVLNHELLKYDKTVAAVLWNPTDIFQLSESFRPSFGHCSLLCQIANLCPRPRNMLFLLQDALMEQSLSQPFKVCMLQL